MNIFAQCILKYKIFWFRFGILYKNETENQFSNYPIAQNNGSCTPSEWSGELNPNATLVEVSGTTIKNALIGIESVFLPNAMPPIWGAIIRVKENCIFENCVTGVKLVKNYAFNSTQGKKYSASYIMRTEFNWTNTLAMNKSKINKYFKNTCVGLSILSKSYKWNSSS